MGQGGSGKKIEGGVVVDDPAFHNAAVAVIRVLTETDIGDNGQVGYLIFYGACRFLNNAVFGVSPGSQGIFLVGKSEKHYGRDAEFICFFGYFYQMVYGELVVAGHGIDGVFDPVPVNGKKGKYQVVCRKFRFTNHTTEGITLS
jgi:hypothetical protein